MEKPNKFDIRSLTGIFWIQCLPLSTKPSVCSKMPIFRVLWNNVKALSCISPQRSKINKSFQVRYCMNYTLTRTRSIKELTWLFKFFNTTYELKGMLGNFGNVMQWN